MTKTPMERVEEARCLRHGAPVIDMRLARTLAADLEAAQRALNTELLRATFAKRALAEARELLQDARTVIRVLGQYVDDSHNRSVMAATVSRLTAAIRQNAGEQDTNESPGSSPATLDRNVDTGPQGQVENAGSPVSPAPDAALIEDIVSRYQSPLSKQFAREGIREYIRRKAK